MLAAAAKPDVPQSDHISRPIQTIPA